MAYVIDHDPSKCDGCLSCVDACSKAHNLPPRVANCRILEVREVKEGEIIKKFAYFSCMQCRKPQCAEACPTGAMRREGDVVVLKDEICVGCLNCIFACPWGVPVFNENTGKVSKCDLCVDRVKAGQKPYCVEACPNEALKVKEKKAPAKKAAAKKAAGKKAATKEDKTKVAQKTETQPST